MYEALTMKYTLYSISSEYCMYEFLEALKNVYVLRQS